MYQPEFEQLDRSLLRTRQLYLLQSLVHRVYDSVPFYKKQFDEYGINPSDITSLDDLKKLPFTTKQDLRDNYPFGMFAVPKNEVVRIHASSGTTGQASVVGYTESDILHWGDLVARAFSAAHLDSMSTIQVAYGYGLFTGGLGAHVGAERLGATAVPMSTGNTRRQIQIMQDFGVTCLSCTPSYALVIAEKARDLGFDPKNDFNIEACVLGAEPFSNDLRAQIESIYDCKAYDIYGLSEVMGPGVAHECSCQNGLHVAEDAFIVEVVDPETGESLPDGEEGELVFTTLLKECSPLIRYRTRDISHIIKGECACGRTFKRIAKPHGRIDDMLIIRGVNVFPSQIEAILANYPELSPHYQIVVTRENHLDVLTLNVEVNTDFPIDEIRKIQQLRRSIDKDLKSDLQLSANVRIVEPRTIERSSGKTKRVLDLREE